MTTELQILHAELEQSRGKAALLHSQLQVVKSRLAELEKTKPAYERARTIIQEVAKLTQQQLEYRLSEIVSTALQGVFPEPYRMVLEFVEARGRTEASILFEDVARNRIDPLQASGGGPVDVAAFALRVTMLQIGGTGLRKTLVLDEPFRFVSRDLQEKAGEMIRMLAEELGIQFIIITHDQNIARYADRHFAVSKVGGTSRVEMAV